MFFGLREGVMHDVDPCCWSLIQRPCRIEDGGRYQKVTRDGGGGWNQKKDYETGKAEDGGHVVVAAVLKLFLLVLTCTVAAVCHRLYHGRTYKSYAVCVCQRLPQDTRQDPAEIT